MHERLETTLPQLCVCECACTGVCLSEFKEWGLSGNGSDGNGSDGNKGCSV